MKAKTHNKKVKQFDFISLPPLKKKEMGHEKLGGVAQKAWL